MTHTTRPTIRPTVSESGTGGAHPGTATLIPGTSLTGIPTTAGSIPMRSASPTTTAVTTVDSTADTTATGEGTQVLDGDTQRGDTAWRVQRAGHGAAILRPQAVTGFRPRLPDVREQYGEPQRTEDHLYAGQRSTAHRPLEDMRGRECHRGASRGCGDLQRALLLRGAARGDPPGGGIPLPRATRPLRVAAAAGVSVAVEAEVRGAEEGRAAAAEARGVAAEGARQRPGRWAGQ